MQENSMSVEEVLAYIGRLGRVMPVTPFDDGFGISYEAYMAVSMPIVIAIIKTVPHAKRPQQSTNLAFSIGNPTNGDLIAMGNLTQEQFTQIENALKIALTL